MPISVYRCLHAICIIISNDGDKDYTNHKSTISLQCKKHSYTYQSDCGEKVTIL